MTFKKLHNTEIIVTVLIGLSLLVGLYYAFILGAERFESDYVVEDGLVEYGTAFCLLGISLYSLRKFIKYKKNHALLWCVGTLGFFALFLFGAGEEVSWGQRIIGFETPESLKEINRQDEVTLHNIRIGDFDVNKIIFSQLLTVILSIYFVLFPWLYAKVSWIKELSNKFGVPVPQLHHSAIFIAATVIALILPSEKKWELHEFVFSAVFLMIFLFPFNKDQIN